MADNRIAYGLAKKHGIDTTGMTPQQVWDALKERGISFGKDRETDNERLAQKYGDTSLENSSSQRKREKVKLSKREYAIADKARKEKYAEYRRNGIPKQDYVFTDSKFVIFSNKSRDNFSVQRVLDIEKEREIITEYLGDLK